MSFQQGGGGVDEEELGWMVEVWGGGVIAPDVHTPTPTNYHCVIENKEEVKTEATQTRRVSLSVSLHRDRKKK